MANEQDKRDCKILREELELLGQDYRKLLNVSNHHTSKMRLMASKKGVRCDEKCYRCSDLPCLEYP